MDLCTFSYLIHVHNLFFSSSLSKFNHSPLRVFVKVKKSKNSRKTRKWVGVSSPNSDSFLFLEMLCFLYIFGVFCCTCFQKNIKNG